MLTLCLDTTSDEYFVGLARQGTLEHTASGRAGRALDTEIFSALKSVMAQGETSLNELDRIAVCIGPGSFVGTRIGLAIANTLARVRALPIIAINTLDTLATFGPGENKARASGKGGAYFCALNCVRDEVFWQKFVPRDNIVSAEGEIAVLPFDDFAKISAGFPVFFRASTMRNTLDSQTIHRLNGVSLVENSALFAAFSRLAHTHQAAGAEDDPSPPLPTPLYIKPETTRKWQP